jgi:hypothetical protein
MAIFSIIFLHPKQSLFSSELDGTNLWSRLRFGRDKRVINNRLSFSGKKIHIKRPSRQNNSCAIADAIKSIDAAIKTQNGFRLVMANEFSILFGVAAVNSLFGI